MLFHIGQNQNLSSRVHQLQTDEKGEIYPKLSSEMNEFVIMKSDLDILGPECLVKNHLKAGEWVRWGAE